MTLRQMTSGLKPWMLILGLPTLIVSGSGGAWAILDYLQVRPVLTREFNAHLENFRSLVASVQEVQRNQMLMRWQLLDVRRQNQGLSLEERVEYCAISRSLAIKAPGCATDTSRNEGGQS